MNEAVVLDINETVLDLSALDLLFDAWFGDEPGAARKLWFTRTLHVAMTLAATREYRRFGDVGAAALGSIANRYDVILPEDAVDLLQIALRRLPAHPDVEPALNHLRAAGMTVVALSNNSLATLGEQLRYAGIFHLFDDVISVDDAGALKPSPEVYRYTADRLRLPPASLWMIAAHGWDIAGAMRSGFRGAFVARPGQEPDPFSPPDIIASNLLLVAREITATQSRVELAP